jgi:hypothetical protein
MHCHMTHHVMSQMGHGLPLLIGANMAQVDRRMRSLVPGYMTMGAEGMGGMADMQMRIPPNSVPMRGGPGPFGTIEMGGMFTVVKVRDEPDAPNAGDWFVHPPGTQTHVADAAAMASDGIDPNAH